MPVSFYRTSSLPLQVQKAVEQREKDLARWAKKGETCDDDDDDDGMMEEPHRVRYIDECAESSMLCKDKSSPGHWLGAFADNFGEENTI